MAEPPSEMRWAKGTMGCTPRLLTTPLSAEQEICHGADRESGASACVRADRNRTLLDIGHRGAAGAMSSRAAKRRSFRAWSFPGGRVMIRSITLTAAALLASTAFGAAPRMPDGFIVYKV